MGNNGIVILGLQETLAKLSPKMAARPARNFMNRSTIAIQSAARKHAWVDRGQWKNSIATEVDTAEIPNWGRVGSNLGKDGIVAMSIELGSKPHWAPLAPLEAWAQRHGMEEGAGRSIQLKIAKYGTPANLAITDGVTDSLSKIENYIAVMAREIEADAAAGSAGSSWRAY